MNVAIVHDWLDTNTGAERVLKALLELYPQADLFAVVDFFSDRDRKEALQGKRATTSFIQKLPFAKKHFRNYLPLFPKAVESFDLDGYGLVISSSWAVAKGAVTGAGQVHVCYCHTPVRYAWDLYDEYTQALPQPKKWLVRRTLDSLRRWDRRTANRVDYFIANSEYVKARIRKSYDRDAVVIHPPVDTAAFTLRKEKEGFYLTASRLVHYKKTAMIVEAFNRNGRPLVVIGDGEAYAQIAAMAKPNVRVLGWQSREVLIDHMQRARAFVYAAEEDFGIVPVEAMACGTPVIAFGRGGVRDSVVPGKSGMFFEEQTPESLNRALIRFEATPFNPVQVSQHASTFSRERFRQAITDYLNAIMRRRNQMNKGGNPVDGGDDT